MLKTLVGLAGQVVATRGTAVKVLELLPEVTPTRAAVAPGLTSSTTTRKVNAPLSAKVSRIVLRAMFPRALRRSTATSPLNVKVPPEILTGPFVEELVIVISPAVMVPVLVVTLAATDMSWLGMVPVTPPALSTFKFSVAMKASNRRLPGLALSVMDRPTLKVWVR